RRARPPNRSLERIVDRHVTRRDPEADGGGPPPRPLPQAEVAAGPRVAWSLLPRVRGARNAGDLRARAVAVVEQVAPRERRERRLVGRRPFGLWVGAARTADVRAFV